MGKIEQLASVAGQLSDEQLDSVIAFATSLTEPSFYEMAPDEIRASIEQGLADVEAGRTIPLETVRRNIDALIAKTRR